jgi:hypothetical protein
LFFLKLCPSTLFLMPCKFNISKTMVISFTRKTTFYQDIIL